MALKQRRCRGRRVATRHPDELCLRLRNFDPSIAERVGDTLTLVDEVRDPGRELVLGVQGGDGRGLSEIGHAEGDRDLSECIRESLRCERVADAQPRETTGFREGVCDRDVRLAAEVRDT